jgi:hypothetical protein
VCGGHGKTLLNPNDVWSVGTKWLCTEFSNFRTVPNSVDLLTE